MKIKLNMKIIQEYYELKICIENLEKQKKELREEIINIYKCNDFLFDKDYVVVVKDTTKKYVNYKSICESYLDLSKIDLDKFTTISDSWYVKVAKR